MIIKGVRESIMRSQISILTVVRNTTKRKGNRQGETEGEEDQEDLKRMKKQKKFIIKKILRKKTSKEKNIRRRLPANYKQPEALSLILFGYGMKKKDSVSIKKLSLIPPIFCRAKLLEQ
jgi:hypothetical protein